jgi:serine phosphatase RsbU (regulator of sigma subunit)
VLAEVLRANREKSAAEIVAAVMKALVEHAGDLPTHDDRTLIVAKRS